MCYGLTAEKKKKEEDQEVVEDDDTAADLDERQPSFMSTSFEFLTDKGSSAADFLKKNAEKMQSRLQGDYGATKDSRIEKWFKGMIPNEMHSLANRTIGVQLHENG